MRCHPMTQSTTTKLRTDKPESIFRPKMIFVLGALGIIYLAAVVFADGLKDFARLCLGSSLCAAVAEKGLNDLCETQTNLLLTSITTLTIITSFLNTRYLGANYKFWLFKHSPYMLTPQENILLMVVNLFFCHISVVADGFEPLAATCFVICWYLFLYLMYQMYVYIIKVSHMFCKLRKNLYKSCQRHTWNDMCDHIYKKLISYRSTDERNSYLNEECEIIIQMIVMYRDNRQNHDNESKIIENLKDILIQKIKNEVYVRCNQYTCLKDSATAAHLTVSQAAEIEKVYQSIAADIIERGNLIVEHEKYQQAYIDSKTAEENLSEALDKWMGK